MPCLFATGRPGRRRKSLPCVSLFVLLLAVLATLLPSPVMAQKVLGGEFAAFDMDQLSTTGSGVTFNIDIVEDGAVSLSRPRQDMCERYHQFRDGNITLRDALRGMELHPLMRVGNFFRYDNVSGIDPNDPGLLARMVRTVLY